MPQLTADRVKCGLATTSAGAFKLTFATLLTMAALGATYQGSNGNFPTFELQDVLLRGMMVNCVALAVALAISLRYRAVGNGLFALVTFVGVFTSYLVHTELFYADNRVWLVVIGAASLFALYVAFNLIDDFRWGGLALSLAASLAVGIFVWQQGWPILESGLERPGGLFDWGNPVMYVGLIALFVAAVFALRLLDRLFSALYWGVFWCLAVAAFLVVSAIWLGDIEREAGSGYYADGWEGHHSVRAVAFRETPNLYFVGFDGIIPESILRKYLDVDTTGYHQVFERDMRRFSNLFANSVPTLMSLNTVMALDQDVFMAHFEANGDYPSYFAGHDLSPLVWLLRQNGYETSSIYQDAFFGFHKGHGIDNYIIKGLYTVCSLLDRDARPFSFWGFCWERLDAKSQDPSLSQSEFLVHQLAQLDRSRPQFVMSHIYYPGHASAEFDYHDIEERRDFTESYVAEFEEGAIHLETLIRHVERNDPDAILFIFGDHGAKLAQASDLEDDPAFYLQDRFGILGGVYPPDRCGAQFDDAESKGYVTNLDVVHAIISCSVRRAKRAEPTQARPLLG